MRPLGELEAAVMEQMWHRGVPASVRDIMEALQGTRDLAYTTIMTVMDNLHRKGMLTRHMEGRAYVYSPACTQAEYSAGRIAAAIPSGDARTQALLQFVAQLSADERLAIRTALDEASLRRGLPRRSPNGGPA